MLTTAKVATIAAASMSLASATSPSISSLQAKMMEAAKKRYIDHSLEVVEKAKAAGQMPMKRKAAITPYDDDEITSQLASGYYIEKDYVANGNADCKGTNFAQFGK
jgi:hypothetical protein